MTVREGSDGTPKDRATAMHTTFDEADLIIITGMSGARKTSVASILEDEG